MKTKITQNMKAIILGLVIALGAGYVSAWTGPSSAPTGGNVPAPINVGGGITGNIYTQTKSGILNLAHLITSDLTVTNSDATVTNIPSGSILVADGNNTGKVKWGNGSALVTSNCPSGQFVKGVNTAGGIICDYIVPIATIDIGSDEEALISIQGKNASIIEQTRNGASVNSVTFADTVNGMPTDGRSLKITSLSSYGGTSIVDTCPDKATWGGGTYSLSNKICIYQQPTSANGYTTKVALWDGASGSHGWSFTLGYSQ